MKDVEEDLKEKICIFCSKHKRQNCMKIHKLTQKNITIYKCLNFKKGIKNMDLFKEYINYTFYDEQGNYVAIVYENTPKDILEELKKEYDEVKYSEN